MKTLLGLVLIAGFGIIGVPAPAGHAVSMLCLSCAAVDAPSSCTNMVKCHHEDMCYTEVNQVSGVNVFTLSCKTKHECNILTAIAIGRRDTACRKCCPTSGCNKHLCAHVLATTPAMSTTTAAAATMESTTMPATTMAPTTTTTMPPTTLPTCRDHEEEGFSCAAYDVYNFCTDTGGFAFVIAHEKCPKHCGFCGGSGASSMAPATSPSATPDMNTTTMAPAITTEVFTATAAPTTEASTTPASNVCEDREDANFKCTDKIDLCLDTSYFAMELALDRCPKYCGLCVVPTTQAAMTTTSGGFSIV